MQLLLQLPLEYSGLAETGYAVGAGNITAACAKYNGIQNIICNNAWLDRRTPGLNDSQTCSSNNTQTNSCYKIGNDDGHDVAEKLIAKCHEGTNPSLPGHHSKEYLEGYNNGFSDANAAATNDNNTYGDQCTKYF
ncbi:MAG: hypothetical protein WAM14_12205 [Candidatus Nitrosopolaris sp.]